MSYGETIVRFQNLDFYFTHNKPILTEVNFSVKENSKLTIMGQNGAGKSTIFKLLMKELQPKKGEIFVKKGTTIGIAKQVIPTADLTKTVKEYFASAFNEKKYDLDKHIARVLDAVNLTVATDKVLSSLSGGQKARLLLAYALIQEPDVLLLDEPTNNLDAAGIAHLTSYLIMYEKTCIVISHDADFLNSFTHGVLHLDVHTQKVDFYEGDYYDVVENIQNQIEKEQRQNARMEKAIQDQKDKINFFSHKGGKMRKLASKMRDAVEEAEDNKVDVRREDKTIPEFTIEMEPFSKPLAKITSVSIIKDHKPVRKKVDITILKNHRVRIIGPNGIGKTTLLETLASGHDEGVQMTPGVKVGYYRQDFSGLSMEKSVYDTLGEAMALKDNQLIYATAARFLLPADSIKLPVGVLSEGQKGLLSFARLMLLKPTLLVLDEPTNHINFRHLPVIAAALQEYKGGMILVSHDEEFMKQISVHEVLDLEKL